MQNTLVWCSTQKWFGKDEYRPKIMIITLKDQYFVSAQKAHFHISSAANKSKLADFWNKTLCHNAYKYVCSGRTIFVETKLIIHGAWWCTYLHTYLLLQERDVRGAKKHMRERRISFISCLATKKKTVLHSSFFFPTLWWCIQKAMTNSSLL